MNHIYTTKAIIIKSAPYGEANKIYFLLTRDFGFIKATAQSVRSEKSKLRGHLSDFTLANISFVKGKEIWRITSAETFGKKISAENSAEFSLLQNIFSLLLRLLAGEEKNEELFDCVNTFYDFIAENRLSDKNIKNAETIIVMRILYYLGYFEKPFDLSSFAEKNELSIPLFDSFDDKRRHAILEINKALAETHL